MKKTVLACAFLGLLGSLGTGCGGNACDAANDRTQERLEACGFITSGAGGADTTTGTGGGPTAVPCGVVKWAAAKVGNPMWSIEDWQVYSGPVGTVQTGFGAALATVEAVWPGHHYIPAPSVIGPLVPHPPPYDHEASAGVTRVGFESCGTFAQAAWQGQMGLLFSAVIVPAPAAPVGRTPDGDGLPMIPDEAQIEVDGNLYVNGALVDPALGDGPYPGAAAVTSDVSMEGHSHMPLNFFENTSVIAGSPGHYTFEANVHEGTTGYGYTVHVDFTIVP